MTKLEPIQRQSSESVADVLLSRERDTSWGTAYVPESIGTTRQIDPSITKRNSNAEDVSEAVESSNVENGRPTRRRYRSLRSGLWDSEDGKSASDRPRSHEEFSSRYSTQEDEDAGKKKSRHDDIRERIRRYKEKNEKEKTMFRQASEETSDYSLRRSRPASDGSSINRLSRIFEKRSVSYAGKVFSAEDQIDRKEEIGSDDVNPRDSLPCEISDDEKIPNDTTMHISENDRRDTSSFDRHRIIVHMDCVEEAEISKSKAQQKSSYTESIADKLAVIDVAEKKISNDDLQLKSGVSEVMEQSDLSNKHHYIEDTSGIIEENITVVDAFSVLAEKELEDAEPETAQKASPRLHMNTDDDNNNTVTSLKSLGNELKNRKDKLKSKRVSATPLTPASTGSLSKAELSGCTS
uniref:uncharacterized protein LOC120341263 n=1 Tax=Styela clava TaxID=7725 RepID=UPI001939DF08|nr:uncharacterized protein LOC120341263 [Styela clava]